LELKNKSVVLVSKNKTCSDCVTNQNDFKVNSHFHHYKYFCFLALLKNCENVVALLHYNNQAAAAFDYIMFNFDNFSISNFVWTGFIKESSHLWSKKVKLLLWNRPKK
jgi:hypothetical protein